jgi:hypothetical protein
LSFETIIAFSNCDTAPRTWRIRGRGRGVVEKGVRLVRGDQLGNSS